MLLLQIGALLVTVNGVLDEFDGDLTAMGRTIAVLPMDVRLGKLIFLGNLYDVLDDCIVMGKLLCEKLLCPSKYLKI